MSTEIKARHRTRFNEWAKVYDQSILQRVIFNTSHDMFYTVMIPWLKDKSTVLDVGCGTGKFTLRLQKINSNFRIHGVDLSEVMINKAKAKVKDGSIEFKVGDVESLPYESNTFDVITCSNSFHHYPNQRGALIEMQRVLKDGGKLMIVDGTRDTWWGNIIFSVVEFVERQVYHMYGNELKDLLHSVGYGRIHQKMFNPIAPLLLTVAEARKEKL
ncbi:MAG: class I SAM-dependent methyltransferase [Candidatus Omnitrophota bacterium]